MEPPSLEQRKAPCPDQQDSSNLVHNRFPSSLFYSLDSDAAPPGLTPLSLSAYRMQGTRCSRERNTHDYL